MWTDPDLLLALQKGDARAWDETFRRLYPSAFAAARHPLAGLTPAECEDIAIEALTLLLPKIGEVAEFHELRALVVTIAARKAISEKRRQLAHKRGAGAVGSLDAMLEDEALRFEPVERLVSHLTVTDVQELSALLAEALAGLELIHAALLRDFIMHRLPYKELAEKYSMPMGSIGVVLARSLKKIRTSLAAQPQLWKELTAFLR